MANPAHAAQWEREDETLAERFGGTESTPVVERVRGALETLPADEPSRAFDDRVSTTEEFEKMPEEYRQLLTRVLRIQADCEIGGPHLYVRDWVLTAPTADDQWRMARIAAEEVDHFRKFNRLLHLIGSGAEDRLTVEREERYVDAFRGSMPSWADLAAFSLLIDRVGKYQLQEFEDSSFEPLNKVLPPIMAEEAGHISFGHHKMQALLADNRRDDAQAAIDRWFREGLRMFGTGQSKRDRLYIKWGLKRRTNQQAREAYRQEAEQAIRELGLQVPEVEELASAA